MDAVCPHCSTQYDFDESRIPPEGLDVRCSHCGDVFHARPDQVSVGDGPEPKVVIDASLAVQTQAELPDQPWRVQTARGEELELHDFSVLQRWIIERRVARDDLISRTGKRWRPLGDIVELSSFFLAVEGLGTSGEPTSPPREAPPMVSPTPPPSGQETVVAPPPPGPPSAREPAPTLNLKAAAQPPAEAPMPVDVFSPELQPPQESQKNVPTVRRALPPTPPQNVAPPQPSAQAAPPLPPPSTPPPSLPHQPRRDLRPQAPSPRFAEQAAWVDDGIPMRNPESLDIQLEEEPRGKSKGAMWPFLAGVSVCAAIMLGVYAFVLKPEGQRREVEIVNQPKPPAPAAPTSAAGQGAIGAPVEPSGAERQAAVEGARAALDQGRALILKNTNAAFAEAGRLLREAAGLSVEGPEAERVKAEAQVALAQLAVLRGDYQRMVEGLASTEQIAAAERAIAEARRLNPAGAVEGVATVEGELQRLQGERAAAEAHLEKAKSVGEAAAPLALATAALALLSEDGQEAIAATRALSPEASKLPRARIFKAVALRKGGQIDDAIKALDALIADQPDHPVAATLKARYAAEQVKIAAKAKEKEAAEAQAAQQQEESFDALMGKGDRLLERGRTREAARLFRLAIERNPRSPEPRSALAWCYLDEGQHSRAIQNFRDALARSGRYADAMYGIAVAYERAGQTAQAKRAYQEYVDIHPRGRQIRMAQRKLEILK